MSSSRIKPIVDPEDKEGKPIKLPTTMRLREINPMNAKGGGKPVPANGLKNVIPEDKLKGMNRIPVVKDNNRDVKVFNCVEFAEKALESIEPIENQKGFAIGKGSKRVYCGPVIQRIPMGGYACIGGGESIFLPTPPVVNEAKITFKFDKKRQLAIKVGNNVGKDLVVVVGYNGCVLLDTGSYASFHTPVFVVEQTGDYYKVDGGNRILLLGTGHHLIFYTKEAPILFVRKHTVTHKNSIPMTPIPSPPPKSSSLKSNSLASNEPLEQMAKENKAVLKKFDSFEDKKKTEEPKKQPEVTIDEVVKHESAEETETIEPLVSSPPKVEEDFIMVTPKSEEIKEIKGMSITSPPERESPPPLVHQTVSPPKESNAILVELSEGETNWKTYAGLIGLILLLLLLLFIIYRYLSGESKPVKHNHPNG